MRFSKTKKGMTSQLVALILIIVAAIVLFIFVGKFGQKTTFEEAINVCHLSVMTQAASDVNKMPFMKSSPLDIDCEKRYVNFYNTRVELGLNPDNMQSLKVQYDDRSVTRFTQLSEFIVNQVVAEEMRTCWYQFGEGQAKVFPNDKTYIFDQNVCFVCSEIDFKDFSTQKTFYNFLDYINNTKMNGEGQTYYQYFNQPSLSSHTWQEYNYDNTNPISIFSLNFNTDTKYYVVFIKDYSRLTWKSDNYYVQVVPQDKINTRCDLQPN